MVNSAWWRFDNLLSCFFFCFLNAGSISNIDDTDYKCVDGTVPDVRNKVISGVVGASSSVTSIQVANLLRLFKIPQVRIDPFLAVMIVIIVSHLLSTRFAFQKRFPSSHRVLNWVTSNDLNISRGQFHPIITRWWPSSRWFASSNGPTFPFSTRNPPMASK